MGCQHGPGGAGDPGLSAAETRTHFAAWSIVSSPLTLSHDINNKTVMDEVWDVVSNREAIAVNQAWAGHSGSPFKSSDKSVQLDATDWAALEKGAPLESVGAATASSWKYYYKPMLTGGAKTAVLLMNNDDSAQDLTLSFADIPGVTCTKCAVRDIWAKKDLGTFDTTYVAKGVASHDAPFLIITPASAPTVESA